MNYKISFQEMSEMGQKILSKQSPITLKQAKEQVERLKLLSVKKNKKQRN
ncbi:MAG TPA: hypothetical protein VIJ92_16575 [Ginsengibacter sp.]